MGDTITEVDVNLFTTLARFDAVYHNHFKCNRHKLTELPVLWAYARDLFQTPGFGDTIDFSQIKQHYYLVHTGINPDPDRARRAESHRLDDPALPRTTGRPTVRGRYPTGTDGLRRGRTGRERGAGRLKRVTVGLLAVALVAGLGGWRIWLSRTGSEPAPTEPPAGHASGVPSRPADAERLTVRYVYDGDTLQLQAATPGRNVTTRGRSGSA